MNKTSKIALLGAAMLAAASTAHATYSANGTLLLGSTRGTGNDFILSLGTFSTLTDGETWNLNGSVWNNVDFGVVGANNTGSIIYSTVAHGSTLPDLSSFTTVRANISAIGSYSGGAAAGTFGTPAFNSANGWWTQTDQPGAPSGNIYQNNYANPNAGATSGTLIADFFAATGGATPTSTFLGDFTLDTGTGIVTWHAVAVPEPSTYGVLAAAGVLLVTLRRQLVKA